MKKHLLSINLTLLLASAHFFFGFPTLSPLNAASTEQESLSWKTDQVALRAQQKAIDRLQTLISGNPQDPLTYLSRLADLQVEKAAIEFRLAHARVHFKKSPLNLSNYHQALRASIQTLQRCIDLSPSDGDRLPTFLAMRAKANEELHNLNQAKIDYTRIVQDHAHSDSAILAHMSLAEMAITANQHLEALRHLNWIAQKPEHPQYPFALSKKAWSQFNLGQIAESLQTIEVATRYYQQIQKRFGADAPPILQTLKESLLLDSAIFVAQKFQDRSSSQTQAEVEIRSKLEWMLSLTEQDSTLFGKWVLRLAKLLRTQGQDSLLNELQAQFRTQKGSVSQESLDLATLIFEHQVNQHRYLHLDSSLKAIVDTGQDVGRHSLNWDSTLRILERAAQSLRTQIDINLAKKAELAQLKPYQSALKQLYLALSTIVEKDSEPLRQIHFNLGELYFAEGDDRQATQFYLKAGKTGDAFKRAALSRYRLLKNSGELLDVKQLVSALSPQDLRLTAASALSESPEWTEWAAWIRQMDAQSLEVRQMKLELARDLYRRKQFNPSLEMLHAIILEAPATEEAIAAANLLIDTWITSQNWELTREFTTRLLENPDWKNHTYSQTLQRIQRDLDRNDLKRKIASAIENQHIQEASVLLDRLTQDPALSESERISTLLTRAELSEKENALALQLKALNQIKDPATVQKIPALEGALKNVIHSLLEKKDYPELFTLTQSAQTCFLETVCQPLKKFSALLTGTNAKLWGNRSDKDVYASFARISEPKKIKLHELIHEFKLLARRWNDVPAELQPALFTYMEASLVQSVEFARQSLQLNRVQLDERALTYRFESHQTFEASVLALIGSFQGQSPFIKLKLLTALESAYSSLIGELNQLIARPSAAEAKGTLSTLTQSLIEKQKQLSLLMPERVAQ